MLTDNETHMRGLTIFTLGATYTPVSYLSLIATYSTQSFHLDSDSTRENPIWNEFSSVSLTAMLSIDGLYRSSSAAAAPAGQQNLVENEDDHDDGRNATATAPRHRTAW